MNRFDVVFNEGEMFDASLNEGEVFTVKLSPSLPQYNYEGSYEAVPTEEEQTLFTANRLLAQNITIDPIPEQYIIPTGTQSIIANGVYDITNKANVDVQVALKQTVLRPDAELVKTYTYDKMIVKDEKVTLPGYTTSATTLKASANLSPTISINGDDETFFVVERFLTIPEYSISTVAKGRAEYTYCAYLYEMARVPADSIKTIDGSKAITSVSNIFGTMTTYRLLYWSSASAISLYSTNAYGCYQTPTAPTFSGSTLTIKSPALGTRGSTSYFTSTFMSAMTDIRYQYIIDVYKAPKQSLGINGWITNELVNHILGCANSMTHTLS